MIKYMNFAVSLPSWVKWIAQDANGKWYGYSKEPFQNYPLAMWDNKSGSAEELATGFISEDWTQELYQVK